MTRAHITLGALVVAVASCLPIEAQRVPQVRTQAPGFYRQMLGQFEITALSDGTLPLPLDRVLTNITPGQLQAALRRTYLTLPVETSINCFLINTGTLIALVDAGSGDAPGIPQGGRLVAALNAAGYATEQVSMILLSHSHGDHAGGLVRDGVPVFSRATLVMHERERQYWLDATNPDSARRARVTVAAYKAAGGVRTFDRPEELAPGFRAIPAPGHTPGHTYYSVESRGERLVFWGDVVHSPEVQFTDPAVTVTFDHDSPAAAGQRATAFRDAATQGYWVAAPHIAFPGIGHLRQEGNGYAWIPTPYRAGPFQVP